MQTASKRYLVQLITRPYGVSEQIPESAWVTRVATKSESIAISYFERYRKWYVQSQSYSGHVRILDAETGMLMTPDQDRDDERKLARAARRPLHELPRRLAYEPYSQYDADVRLAAIQR